ncbi:glycosyltransferase family 1 protein [Coprococcus sp. AF18-48]|nr:glycosyltransferase family 1 protein [Coprococcus sp. AF18-48]
MKKICYVVTVPVTIKAFFVPQLQYLAEHDFEVHVICSEDDELQEILGENIKYIPLNMPRGISVEGTIRSIKELVRIFKREKYDLVQYSTPNAALYASIAARIVRCRVRNYHLMGFRYLGAKGSGANVLKILEKITCFNSTSIECVSKSNFDLGIREKIFTSDKATVVWNGSTGGVDLKRFDYSKRELWRAELREKYGYQATDFIYGFIGRITKDKGIDELLEAFFKVNNGSKLFLIGNIEDEEKLNKELWDRAKANSDVLIHEAVSDIEKYYAMIDVLVFPSYREGFGNAVIEAGVVGTPAIITKIPGPIDTVKEDVTALTVPVKDVEALSFAMDKMKKCDTQKMGKQAVKFVTENFDSHILNQKIEERKRQLLKI